MSERRVALLGAGLAAEPHLRALAELECSVVTVASRDAGRIAAVRRHFPAARPCWPAERALDADGLFAALVLTPPSTHLELVQACAQRDIHVVVEKPLDVTVERARQCCAVTAEAGVGLAVCLQHRFKPAVVRLRAALDDGALGRFEAVACHVPWWRPQRYYDEPGRGTYARDGGGVLMTQAIHVLDTMLHLVGDPVAVHGAVATTSLHRLEAEDLATAILDFGDGRLGTVFATTSAFAGSDEQLDVIGSGGTARLHGSALRIDLIDGTAVTVDPDEGASSAADPAALPWPRHAAVLQDAFTAFDRGTPPAVDGEQGLRSLRLIAAIVESARTRQPAELRS